MPGVGGLAFEPGIRHRFMHRFVYHTSGSFFNVGRDRRNTLVREHQRLDPIIAPSLSMRCAQDGGDISWVSIPLAWCGMWAGSLISLLLIPGFALACVARLDEGTTVVAALCGAGHVDASTVCDGRQSLYGVTI